MALLIGRKTLDNNPLVVPATDLIAKCLTEDGLIKIIGQYVGFALGQLKCEMDPLHFYNSSNIDNAEYAYNFKDGWVYPNGTYISRYYFPDMYNKLRATSYPVSGDKEIPGNRIIEGSTIIDDVLILLPNINGYLYADNLAPSHNSIEDVPLEYSLEKHNHPLSLAGDTTRITVPRAAWIWSTTDAGAGSIVGSRSFGEKYIPTSASAHSGSGKSCIRLLTWDIPSDATVTVTLHIEADGGDVILCDGSVECTEDYDVHPKTRKFTTLMYIGIPNIPL